ncbi:eukaryotic ribosome biogenesis protein 1 [Moelleriella libera RCEF 2490]|uniref:Eukaryotic ribosome biogenesis protein 1 n=1 Tax=Moelleriella libera RCEF 2490 TaxID=1081109 RepID=A0A166PDZ1_9HYPO|nr:eukaryotic ribosome biogenesis protein 1 [Moelleriella libera RCEF 2490]
MSKRQARKRKFTAQLDSSPDNEEADVQVNALLSQTDSDDEGDWKTEESRNIPIDSLGRVSAALNSVPIQADQDLVIETEPESRYRVLRDDRGQERYEYDEIDPVYDSDDTDAQEPANTIGNIPLSFYDSYPHIGYDIDGKKIMRPATGDALDALLSSIELPKGWTGLTDPETGKPLNLSQDELELLRRLQTGGIPEEGYNPYTDMVPYFTGIEEQMPLSAAPEPKRRFVPSKHEAMRIARLVRAIKDGRILPFKPPPSNWETGQEPETAYDIWANEEPRDPHSMSFPAPKLAPPGYDLSYNPPLEYLPTAEERIKWNQAEIEDREKEYLSAKFDSLRRVPGYDQFVKERFERCLDLYLAPRVRKNKLNVDPSSLLPRLPRPEELKPFPTACQTIFKGHQGRVRSVAISPDGEWLATGGDDGTVRVWALNGHQEWMAKLSSEEAVNTIEWRPNKDTFIFAAAVGEELFFAIPGICGNKVAAASRIVLDAGFGYAASSGHGGATSDGASKTNAAHWSRPGPKLHGMGVLLKATAGRFSLLSVSDRAAKFGFDTHLIATHESSSFPSTTRLSPSGSLPSIAAAVLRRYSTDDPLL